MWHPSRACAQPGFQHFNRHVIDHQGLEGLEGGGFVCVLCLLCASFCKELLHGQTVCSCLVSSADCHCGFLGGAEPCIPYQTRERV